MCVVRAAAQEGSKLCEKKDKIIALFDKLLSKLGGEELSANITYGKVLQRASLLVFLGVFPLFPPWFLGLQRASTHVLRRTCTLGSLIFTIAGLTGRSQPGSGRETRARSDRRANRYRKSSRTPCRAGWTASPTTA